MRFEHLIQLNDPLVPLLDMLTREQVWRGLVLRAHQPLLFVMGLEDCTITARSQEGDIERISRTLNFGSFQVHDHVTLTPGLQIEIQVEPSDRWPSSRATVRIEEPNPEELFLRFIYEWDDQTAEETALDETARQIRQQAYVAADMDTVQRIGELAAAGGQIH